MPRASMRPTRGGVVLVAMIIFVLLIATPTSATVFIVLGIMLAVMLLNIPYSLMAVRALTINRTHASHVKENTEMKVSLRVTNHSRAARVLLRLFDGGPRSFTGDPLQIPLLEGKKTQVVSYKCNTGRRGVHSFSSCRVESSSPFGLVNARTRLPVISELIVYPVYYELMGAVFPFRKTYSGLTAAPGSRAGEGASFFGLREYRHGDPIRKIHWPSTVRARTVMIKEFEEDMHSSVAILMDTYRKFVVTAGKDTNLEVAVRSVASLANYTLTCGHPTGLAYFDGHTGYLRTDSAMGDLTPILDGLARLYPSSKTPVDLVRAATGSVSRQSNWIVVLLSADREALSELLKVRARGTEILVVISDRYGSGARERHKSWLPPVLDMLDSAGVRVVMVSPEDDLQAVLSHSLRAQRKVKQ
jgi:uncharacterized protein (DUF58 family)